MVYGFMKMNLDLVIEIGGYINCFNQLLVFREFWYYELLWDRVKVIFDYFLVNEVDFKCIFFKGYGNWKMCFFKV